MFHNLANGLESPCPTGWQHAGWDDLYPYSPSPYVKNVTKINIYCKEIEICFTNEVMLRVTPPFYMG